MVVMYASLNSVVGSGHANEIVLKLLEGRRSVRRGLNDWPVRSQLKAGEDARALPALQDGTFTMPPWSGTRVADVSTWAKGAGRLLSVRASVFAASGGARFTGTRGDTIATQAADGSTFPADEEYLGRFVTRLERHIAEGTTLRDGLDYRDDRGRRWPLVSIYRRNREPSELEQRLRIPEDWERWLSA
ncbi:MAG: hypothetical protein HIU88_11455 [Acidobacteria bacterium]|nr:hypothetical protein [Acidobacteriota bacterium]